MSHTDTAPFVPDDLFLERRITELHLAPDSRRLALSLKQVDRPQDRTLSQLWLVDLDPAQPQPPRQLTRAEAREQSPRWSPDGRRIAFLSDRAGDTAQIHLISPDGGEARALTDFAGAVSELQWRPDGRQLAAVCALAVDPERRAKGCEDLDLHRKPRSTEDPELAWRLPYKLDGQGYALASRQHLVLVDAHSGEGRLLTHGDFDVGEIAWSPDGWRLVYSRSRDEAGQQHCSDLWVLNLGPQGAEGEPECWRCELSTAASPAWSPDGRWVAFVGALDGGDAVMRLWLREVSTGQVRPVGDADLEVVPEPLQWSADSERLRFIRAHRGTQQVAQLTLRTREVRALVAPERGQVGALVAAERLFYTEEGVDHPQELHGADACGANPCRLSDFNAWWRERQPLQLERRRFELPDGRGGQETVEGWLLRRADAEGRMPLLVDVHGGPASYVSLQYGTSPHWQVLASRGWAVLALDAVGSSSYGREFSERLRARWGELDLPQHLGAIEALREQGLADERVAISGSSYGGYLGAWAIGHCETFRAAVISAPVANLESHFGSSDSGYFADPYSMDGKPESNRELMLRLSPMAQIEQACTPTLFIQGKDDERCPRGQSEEIFVKLQRAGTPTELVLYPGGSHHLIGQGRPAHRLDAVRRIVGWLERWINKPLPSDD